MDVCATDPLQRDTSTGEFVVKDLLDSSAVETLVAGMDAVDHLANHSTARKARPVQLPKDNASMSSV